MTHFRTLGRPSLVWLTIGLLACVLMLAGCATSPSLREQLDTLPCKHLSFYDFDRSVALEARIAPIPDELLDLYSRADGMTYERYQPTSAEREEIGAVLERLPVRHQAVLRDRLIAIYCIENFTGSGMADFILARGDELYSVLVLHPRVVSMSA